MEDFKSIAQKKYLDAKRIKIEEEEILKQKEEEYKKMCEEQTKKQVYIQSQLMIIDEAIKSFKTEQTDDNIMLILTIIYGTIDNIQKLITNDEKKIITELVVKFTTDVDKLEIKRPKGINTIANVQILKDGFKRIYDLLDLDVDIQTQDTENDEKFAKELEKQINIGKKQVKMPHVLDTDVDDDDDFKHHIPTISPIGVKKPVPIKPAPFQPPPAPPVPFQAPPAPPTDNYMGDSDSESEDEYNKSDVDDETYARNLQKKLNKPKVNKPRKAPVKRQTNKYEGLNSDDFINKLLFEHVNSN